MMIPNDIEKKILHWKIYLDELIRWESHGQRIWNEGNRDDNRRITEYMENNKILCVLTNI